MIQNNSSSKARRQQRVRAKLLARTDRPRLSVLRSNKHISAQIIDQTGKVLAIASSVNLKDEKGTKVERASKVGKLLSENAKKNKIETVVFDRGPYRFHGRVKALAEGVREGGIKF